MLNFEDASERLPYLAYVLSGIQVRVADVAGHSAQGSNRSLKSLVNAGDGNRALRHVLSNFRVLPRRAERGAAKWRRRSTTRC
jgi:hypothetical protein